MHHVNALYIKHIKMNLEFKSLSTIRASVLENLSTLSDQSELRIQQDGGLTTTNACSI